MQKTVSHIASEVYEKTAAPFYRGMGEPFIPDVLRAGLSRGRSVSTSPEIAQEYAGKGATNVLEGDITNIPKEYIPRRTSHAADVLERLGLSRHTSEAYAPLNLKPAGGVLKMEVPDAEIQRYLGQEGLSNLGERVVTEHIPPHMIERLPGEYRSPGTFPAVMRRLTGEQMRLISAAQRQGRSSEALNFLKSQPQSYALDIAERMANVRASRGLLTSQLRGLLR